MALSTTEVQKNLHKLATFNQERIELLHSIERQAIASFTGQFDEPRVVPELLGLPSQVEGVDRDAVPTQPRAGVEGLEPEWLGRGGGDHLPNVDAHRHEQPMCRARPRAGPRGRRQGDVRAAGVAQEERARFLKERWNNWRWQRRLS